MKIAELQQSKYLKKTDFEEPQIVTIKDIAVENVSVPGQPKKERAVVFFREKEKGMVFNSTNLKRAAQCLGSEETDDWMGKRVVVFFDENVEFGGDLVGGLRVRGVPRAKPQPTQPAAIKGMDDDIPWEDDK